MDPLRLLLIQFRLESSYESGGKLLDPSGSGSATPVSRSVCYGYIYAALYNLICVQGVESYDMTPHRLELPPEPSKVTTFSAFISFCSLILLISYLFSWVKGKYLSAKHFIFGRPRSLSYILMFCIHFLHTLVRIQKTLTCRILIRNDLTGSGSEIIIENQASYCGRKMQH